MIKILYWLRVPYKFVSMAFIFSFSGLQLSYYVGYLPN